METTITTEFNNSDRFTEIGYAIAYYRKKRGLSQEELGERVGISRQHIGGIEASNMDRRPSLDLLFNIATVLSIEPFLLLKFPHE